MGKCTRNCGFDALAILFIPGLIDNEMGLND